METSSSVKRALLVLPLLVTPTLVGCNMFGGEQDTQAEFESPEQRTAPAAGGNDVYFESGSAEIPLDGLEVIRSLAAASDQSTSQILVTGYADTAGPADYNDELSRRRAEAVAAELAAQGVESTRIDVEWHGEDQLPIPTGDDVSEMQNRRVSIEIASG
jgi:OOP family OmpA-OmpF porin